MTRDEAIDILVGVIAANSEEENEALDMAIEALECENHDGCDGCRYEENDELSAPCNSCKQNYVDNYKPMPNHDRDWIVGCIEHDGFIKTDRGDKANQIILEALKADRQRGEWATDEVAELLANIFGDECACNWNGNDEWLPEVCKYAETTCPSPKEVNGCWKQFLIQGGARRK